MLITILLSLFFLVLGILFVESPKRGKNYPPGPRPFGILGNFPNVIIYGPPKILSGFKELGKSYGKIMAFNFGYTPGLIISDVKILKDAFNNSALTSRPTTEIFEKFHDNKCRGIIIQSGESWRELRRFVVKQLKEYGIGGTNSMESSIVEETQELMKLLWEKKNQPFCTKGFFSLSVVNVLWQVFAGQRFKSQDPKAQAIVNILINLNDHGNSTAVEMFYPWLAKLVPQLFHHKEFELGAKMYSEFAQDFVNQRILLHREGRRDDLVDTFLEEIREISDKNETDSPFYKTVGYQNLESIVRDFFLAGTETTSSTLRWLFLYLAVHPEIQDKLQRELDSVLNGNHPSLLDRTKLVYTEAVINETLRKSSLLSFGLVHAASKNTKISGFDIPKDTWVLGNIYAIHHCEETWGDPYIFRPERFLSEDETTLIKHEAFIPFGIGKRICLGETLARGSLLIKTATIFQSFSVTYDPAKGKPGIEVKQPSASLMPPNHKILISERSPTNIHTTIQSHVL